MNYCEICKTLTEEARCPYCKNKKLRAPKGDDFVLLAQKPSMWADMLQGALNDAQIPNVYDPVLGAGIVSQIGYRLDQHRVCVPYDLLDPAKEVVEAMFGADGEDAPL